MPIRPALTLALAALIALFAASSAQAALTVANTNDSGPGSLRQAIADAPPGETINVPAGTYTLTSGPLETEKPVTIDGAGQDATIVRSDANDRVFEPQPKTTLTLSDLSVRNMRVTGALVGGVVLRGTNVTTALERVTISGVVADANGAPGVEGGIIQGGLISSTGPLTVIDSTISGNTLTAAGGAGKNGGIIQSGVIGSYESLTIRNSSLSGNTIDVRGGQGPTDPGQGGGIVQGGILTVYEFSEGSSSSLRGVSLIGNTVDASAGPGATGGIIQGGTISVGAFKGPVTISDSTIASNVSRSRGATDGIIQAGNLMVNAFGDGSASLVGLTIHGNRSEAAGPNPSGPGNLLASGKVEIANTIVAAGAGSPGIENCMIDKEVKSLGFNIDSLDQCGFSAPGDRIDTDPQLAPPAANGGVGATMAPLLGSPAIDQGSAFGLTTDQRGIVRPIDLPSIPNSPAAGADGSDIGAYELQPPSAFTLGALTKNKKKGNATLVVTLQQPSAGTLSLYGKGLKTQVVPIAGQSEVIFPIAAQSKGIKKALRKKGKRMVGVSVTYSPLANSATTQSLTTKLVKKKKKKRKKSGKRKGGNK